MSRTIRLDIGDTIDGAYSLHTFFAGANVGVTAQILADHIHAPIVSVTARTRDDAVLALFAALEEIRCAISRQADE